MITSIKLLFAAGKSYFIWGAIILGLVAVVGLVYSLMELGEARAVSAQKDAAIKVYSDLWEEERALSTALDAEFKASRKGLSTAQKEQAAHDFDKIHERHPKMYLDIRNNRAARLRERLRAAANQNPATPAKEP